MTPRTWAEKAIEKAMVAYDDCLCKTCAIPFHAKLLLAEHQRMVRAVHRMKRAVDSPDGNYNLGYRRACLDILAALERGRKVR